MSPMLIGLVISLLINIVGGFISNSQISELESDKIKLELQIGALNAVTVLKDMNNAVLRSKINENNSRIEQITVRYGEAIKKVNKWKDKEPVIKYKVLYKTLPAEVIEVKSNECKDIKSIIDGVRSINYDDI